jgi:hypothetical protein
MKRISDMTKHTHIALVLLAIVLAVSCAGIGGEQAVAANRAELGARYEQVKALVDELRAEGVSLPLRQLQQLDRKVQQARQKRDLAGAEAALIEIEAILEPHMGSSAPAVETSPAPSELVTSDSGGARSGGMFDSDIANGECGDVPEGFDAFVGIGYSKYNLAQVYADMGARWAKVPLVAWGLAEANAPNGGIHKYRWGPLDKLVKEYQDAGFHLQMVLKAANPWASDTSRTEGGFKGRGNSSVSAPPKPEHRVNYHAWVAAIVERYDADGHHDMPGIKYPVLYWEIESEAQHEGYWRGSAQEYGELLKLAHDAAKEACPESRIILSGMNVGDLFYGEPTERELEKSMASLPEFHRKGVEFLQYTMSLVDYFDVIELHYNRNYKTIPHEVAWIKRKLAEHGAEKIIWAGDAISTRWLFPKEGEDRKPYDDDTIFSDLTQGREDSEAGRWFRAEQSRVSVKRIVGGAAAGLERVILLLTQDWPAPKGKLMDYYKNWMVAGLIDERKNPRPVYYAVQRTITLMNDFTSVEPVANAGDGVRLFQFEFADRPPLFVAWSDDSKNNVEIRLPYDSATVETIITAEGEKVQSRQYKVDDDKLRIDLDENPRFIFATNK